MIGKVLSEYALVVYGAQCVTLIGTAKMQLLFVDNWDSLYQVVLINTIASIIIIIVLSLIYSCYTTAYNKIWKRHRSSSC